MNRHHIKAVMYKQFCDTLKNKLLLLLIFMFHAAGECDRHYVKKPDECGNNFFPIINVHRPFADGIYIQ